MVRAVSLFSGSLASVLATRLVMDAPGVDEVRLLHFRSPFFRHFNESKSLARQLWLPPVHSQSIKNDSRELTNMNGAYSLKNCCMGCRGLMLRRGLRYMRRVGADFLVTGEVLGTRGLGRAELAALDAPLKDADRVLRSLSAGLLAPTLPQREGWVPPEQVRAFTADTPEETLLALARELDVDRAETYPAGQRCRLTGARFGNRLEDLMREQTFSMNSLELLEFQHYYKRPPDVKIVLSCEEEEKRRLQNFFLPSDIRLYVPLSDAPLALIRAHWDDKNDREITEIVELAARIAGMHAHGNGRRSRQVQAHYRFEREEETRRIQVTPFDSEQELEPHCLRLD